MWEKHDMAKRQLKQNQLYLIKLKIVKVVTNLEIIQPQFLIGQHFSFWQRQIKKKVESETLPPLKRENDVSTLSPLKRENDVSRDKSIFDSYHVVIFAHWLRLFHLYISLFAWTFCCPTLY